MKYLVISDLHGNLEALNGFLKALEDLKSQNGLRFDKLVCLGDMAGYGANPNEIIDWVRENCQIVLAGNHDYAVVGKTDTSYFNPDALKACHWTEGVLTAENRDYLASLPASIVQDDICWAHSSPYEPEEWHYIDNRYDGMDNFPHFTENVCLVGHSHRPVIIEEREPNKVQEYYDSDWKLKDGHRYIFNVGSLGQPRDGNPDPAFAIFDSCENTYQVRRFKYDVKTAQSKIKSVSLPTFLSDRLALGK